MTNNNVLNFLLIVKTINAAAGFERMSYWFVDNALTHSATLFGNNFGKENIYKIILYFIVYLDWKTSQFAAVPYHLRECTDILNSRVIFLVTHVSRWSIHHSSSTVSRAILFHFSTDQSMKTSITHNMDEMK